MFISYSSRKKGTFSREKLKLLLRLTCCRTGHGSEPGYWRVKVNMKYCLLLKTANVSKDRH